jgi:hypothetical protein
LLRAGPQLSAAQPNLPRQPDDGNSTEKRREKKTVKGKESAPPKPPNGPMQQFSKRALTILWVFPIASLYYSFKKQFSGGTKGNGGTTRFQM